MIEKHNKEKSFKKYFSDLIHQRLNFKLGMLAGIITGSIVFYINYNFGLVLALFAFVKQFLFNFFMASYNGKLVERIVYGINKSWKAIFVGGLIPTVIATSSIYLVHLVGQTPEPWHSSYWQAFFNLPIFSFTALMYVKGYDKKFKFLRKLFVTRSSSSLE